MKFTSKSDFLEATNEQWGLLWELVQQEKTIRNNEKALIQILGHLYRWHQLLLGWIAEGKNRTPDLPAKGFNWGQTRQLNALLDKENAKFNLASVQRRLKLSHGRVIKLVESLSESEFLDSGHFAWTGKNALSSYIVPNAVSHYRWAVRKIKRLG